MPASVEDIRGWLTKAKENGATNLIVACDTFEPPGECCYPIEVLPGDNVSDKVRAVLDGPDKLREVYSLSLPIESQLHEHRAWHLQ